MRCVSKMSLELGIRLPRGGEHRRRRIDGHHVMAKRLEVPGEPSLAATEVERVQSRCRDELQELVAVEVPVGVVIRGLSPRDPVPGVFVPGCAKIGRLQTSPLQQAIRRVRHTPKLAVHGLEVEPAGLEPATS